MALPLSPTPAMKDNWSWPRRLNGRHGKPDSALTDANCRRRTRLGKLTNATQSHAYPAVEWPDSPQNHIIYSPTLSAIFSHKNLIVSKRCSSQASFRKGFGTL